ncbi:hypothetical protein MY11210_001824 [Beauveria gryllotalpidicola]
MWLYIAGFEYDEIRGIIPPPAALQGWFTGLELRCTSRCLTGRARDEGWAAWATSIYMGGEPPPGKILVAAAVVAQARWRPWACGVGASAFFDGLDYRQVVPRRRHAAAPGVRILAPVPAGTWSPDAGHGASSSSSSSSSSGGAENRLP